MPAYRNGSVSIDMPANQQVNDREDGWCEILKGYINDLGSVIVGCCCPTRKCIIGLALAIFCLLLFSFLAEMRMSMAASRLALPSEVINTTTTTEIPTTETALWTD